MITDAGQGSPPPSVLPYHISQALRADTPDPDLKIDLDVLLNRPTPLLKPAEQQFLLLYAAGWSIRQAFSQAGLQGNSTREFHKLLQRLAEWLNRDG